jgi:hypothetical protein
VQQTLPQHSSAQHVGGVVPVPGQKNWPGEQGTVVVVGAQSVAAAQLAGPPPTETQHPLQYCRESEQLLPSAVHGGAVVVVGRAVVVVVAHWWLSRIEPAGQHTSSARQLKPAGQHSLSQQVAPPLQHSGPQGVPALAVQQ